MTIANVEGTSGSEGTAARDSLRPSRGLKIFVGLFAVTPVLLLSVFRKTVDKDVFFIISVVASISLVFAVYCYRAAPEKRDGPCEDRGSARICSLSAIVSDCRSDQSPKYLAEHGGPRARRGILGLSWHCNLRLRMSARLLPLETNTES
jgi:hypothetical protein